MIRLRERDALYEMFNELCGTATRLRLHDADARETWRSQCAQLLQAVPDPAQRCAWSLEFARHLAAGCGMPQDILLGWLLEEHETP